MNPISFTLAVARLGGSILATSSFAQTWIQTSAPATNWQAVASSADGQKLVVVASGSYPCYCGGPIFTSADLGQNWTPTSAPTLDWSAVACSADGKKVAAVSREPSGAIYTSSDSGATW